MKESFNVWKAAEPAQLVYSRPTKDIKIGSSHDVNQFLKHIWEDDIFLRERFKVLYLNRANRVISVYEISSGGISGTVVDSRLVFAPAIILGASTIIVAHNHPSGQKRPSQQDIHVTKKLVSGARLLDIKVADHLIITGEDGYYSFKDEGLI